MIRSIATVAVLSFTLAGCVQDPTPYAGDVSRSIPEVASALSGVDMQEIVADTDKELRDAALAYGTSYEFERDILVCEQLHMTQIEPEDEGYELDPQAEPLSDCLNLTISSYGMVE